MQFIVMGLAEPNDVEELGVVMVVALHPVGGAAFLAWSAREFSPFEGVGEVGVSPCFLGVFEAITPNVVFVKFFPDAAEPTGMEATAFGAAPGAELAVSTGTWLSTVFADSGVVAGFQC